MNLEQISANIIVNPVVNSLTNIVVLTSVVSLLLYGSFALGRMIKNRNNTQAYYADINSDGRTDKITDRTSSGRGYSVISREVVYGMEDEMKMYATKEKDN